MPHFLSIYLSRSEKLVTTQRNLKGKIQIKTTFFQRRVCIVGPCELLGSAKQTGRLLLRRGNLFLIIYLEMVWWKLSCWVTVPMHMDTPKVLAHTPRLVVMCNQNTSEAWFFCLWKSLVAIPQSVHLTICFQRSCLHTINHIALIL